MRVEEIMVREVVTAESEWSVGKALDVLHHNCFRYLPVLEDEELVGVLSERDVLEHLLPPPEGDEEEQATAEELLEKPVSEVMTREIISVTPDTEVQDLIDLISDQRIGTLPVVDELDGELRGIVSYTDILEAVRHLV